MPNGLSLDQDYPDISKSLAMFERADGLIPSWTQTLAKGPQAYVKGAAPIYLQRGKGSHVWDIDGNEYIDMTMAVGPLPLGYSTDEVDEAVKAQLADGMTYSLVHPLEVEVAELIREVIPGAEMVRYSKTGADVCQAAVRLARVHTGKTKILTCGYHGWHDWFSHSMVQGGVPVAVQELHDTFPYNDLEALKAKLDDTVAGIMLEPMVFEEPAPGYLEGLRELCTEKGIILIFDEMWTGFRLALGGAQEHFGVTPDLAVYSKAVANGMPLSVLTGKADIMEHCNGDIFFYTTFGGEALSLAAAKKTIEIMKRDDVHTKLYAKGTFVKDGYQALVKKFGLEWTGITGKPVRTMLTFKDAGEFTALEIKSLLQQELIKRGILWSSFHNISLSHEQRDLDYLMEVYAVVLPLVDQAIKDGKVREMLRGPALGPMLRKVEFK